MIEHIDKLAPAYVDSLKMDLYYMGIEYLDRKDYLKAIEYFELSNGIESHFKTYERLFQCYMKISDTDKAFECIKKSYTLNPKNDKTTFEYAEVCTKTGDYKLAEKLLTEILARNPEYKKAEKLLDTIRG
ncbi:MAG: tetratricopeptide repeat protein [Ruminococcus sp.]|nr:tetratricopeptide repeat protein [Ruminococcus sp.]